MDYQKRKKQRKAKDKKKVITVKKNHFFILLFIIAIISITATILFYSFYIIADVREFNMSLIVGNHTGFDVDTEKISFGMITPTGSSCTRFIDLSNKKDYPLKVYINFYGYLAEWVTVSDNYFILKPGDEKKLSFSATAPKAAAYGNYTGTARFVFKRV